MDFVLAAETAAESGGGGYWQLAMILAGIGFLGIFARWRKRRAPVLPTAREMRERDLEPNRYRDAADKAIVELLETSRSLNAQVDTKIRMLNRLVKEAEEATANLEKLLATIESREAGTSPAGPASRPEAPEPYGGDASCPLSARTFLTDLHERIFRLREEGRTVAEIAKATNLSTTEVKFAIESMGEVDA